MTRLELTPGVTLTVLGAAAAVLAGVIALKLRAAMVAMNLKNLK